MGLCVRIVHSTSSTQDPDISRWDTNGFDLFMKGSSKSSGGLLVFLPVCFPFGPELQHDQK